MVDRYRASVTFPSSALDVESVRDAVKFEMDLTNEDIDVGIEDTNQDIQITDLGPGLMEISDGQARYGQLADTENALIAAGVPFDAMSEPAYGEGPFARWWRPGMEKTGCADADGHGDPIITVASAAALAEEIKSMTDPDEIKAAVARLVPHCEMVSDPINTHAGKRKAWAESVSAPPSP